MRYELKIDDLKCWQFTNKEDEKTVEKYLKEGKKLEYSVYNENKAHVFININNTLMNIADMIFKV